MTKKEIEAQIYDAYYDLNPEGDARYDLWPEVLAANKMPEPEKELLLILERVKDLGY